MDLSAFDIVIVGSGFFGATIAERASSVLDLKVCVLERRPHIGGNSYSAIDAETGIEYHKYGTHIFHTNSDDVWKYIQRFTSFTPYRHRVFTIHKGRVYSMPINLGTMCGFFEKYLTPSQAQQLISQEVAKYGITAANNLEQKAISQIGYQLYDAFICGYTRKQWQTDPRELPPEIITRLPVRYNFLDEYFSDKFQGMPMEGYSKIFEKMLMSKRICLSLCVDFFDLNFTPSPRQLLVYTGPIDRFFKYKYGMLGWRTIDLERSVAPVDDFQGIAVMNYADEDVSYTRIHEFKHLHPERRYEPGKSLIFHEYSRFASQNDEPYYPINIRANRQTYDLYQIDSMKIENIVFGGRLGTYRYLDMHQAIGAALKVFDARVRPFFARQAVAHGQRRAGMG